jgi:hypothetical protein
VTNEVRFRVDARGIPPVKAARRLGLTMSGFDAVKEKYFEIGFPRPDPISGNYDLKAIDLWMDSRAGLTMTTQARDASTVFAERLERFRGRKSG